MPNRPTLFLGSTDPTVVALVERLRLEGFWDGAKDLADFTPELEQSVRYFQRTHLGPNGHFLSADGVVGEQTWWALEHATGPAQISGLAAKIPTGVGAKRKRILEVALAEHARGVVEVPNGSNHGPLVDRYLPDWATAKTPGLPWCCFFYSWVVRDALDQWPLKVQEGSCSEARRAAGALGLWIPKGMRPDRPLPGDAFVMDRGGGHGHIGFVLRVDGDRKQINTVEGNCGNRVKVGLRQLDDPEIVGFIDNVPGESATDFELGVALLAENRADATV
jgi:hypothetical protein